MKFLLSISILMCSFTIYGQQKDLDTADLLRLGAMYQQVVSDKLLVKDPTTHLDIRYRPSGDNKEFYIGFYWELSLETDKHEIAVKYSFPQGKSIMATLIDLLEKDSDLSRNKLLSSVSIQHHDLLETHCPHIREAQQRFYEVLPHAITDEDDVQNIGSYHGDTIYVKGFGDRNTFFEIRTIKGNPIFNWATQTRDNLNKCLN